MSPITDDLGPLDEQAFGTRVEPHRRELPVHCWIDGGFGSGVFGSMRCVLTLANGQPAVAGYVRKPGDAAYVPPAIDVLWVQDGVVTEIVTFDGAVFGHFDLPATISAEGGAR
jgi:RNA polymerase sigma-70 factor (ECF subfamily)